MAEKVLRDALSTDPTSHKSWCVFYLNHCTLYETYFCYQELLHAHSNLTIICCLALHPMALLHVFFIE